VVGREGSVQRRNAVFMIGFALTEDALQKKARGLRVQAEGQRDKKRGKGFKRSLEHVGENVEGGQTRGKVVFQTKVFCGESEMMVGMVPYPFKRVQHIWWVG